MNRKKLLSRITRGNLVNVSFTDLVNLATGFGFKISRIQGSHHIFKHPDIVELLNLQDVHGDAKPYQIKQFLRLVERYNLRLERDQ
jgi:predicted RNA binding protein YcfA (HicA-like mRNA interferase family)